MPQRFLEVRKLFLKMSDRILVTKQKFLQVLFSSTHISLIVNGALSIRNLTINSTCSSTTVCSGTGIVILWNCDCGTNSGFFPQITLTDFYRERALLWVICILLTLHCGSFRISTEPNRSNVRG